MLLVSSCHCDVVIFDRIIQNFGTVGLFCQRKRERERGKRGNLRDREEGDKEDVGWKERWGGGGRERDRSDRVVYSVVAGSRKEQQIQWLYRPSPV